MSISIDPLRPYLPIAWLLLAVALLFGGCSWGKSIQAGKSAATIARKDKALTAAHLSLKAAADALRAQNADNQRRVAEAERAARLAGQAEGLAQAQARAATAAADAYQRGLDTAARRKPACEALLRMDVRKECGL
jgi:hypothetical protein